MKFMDAKQVKKGYFLGGIIIFLVIYAVSSFVVHERLEDVRTTIELQISEQQTLLASIAETTARNGADATTEAIVRDCATDERKEFDSLLGRLDAGLSTTELTKLERLFGRCGSFYSERKSVMVARFEREIDLYETYITQLEALESSDEEKTYKVDRWKELVQKEKLQSESFSKLVPLQDKIITTLLSGKSIQSEELKVTLQEARDVQEMLILANTQASQIRAELISL
jgi:hypothetical protein